MLVLWDKGFDGNDFLASVTATRAQFLGRLRSNRRTPVLTRLVDGSYLSVIAAGKVRVIDANITVTCADGTVFTGFDYDLCKGCELCAEVCPEQAIAMVAE